MTKRDDIIAAILTCRGVQDAKWGGPQHDDLHTWGDWSQIAMDLVDKSFDARCYGDFDRCMINIAALAFAAIESSGRHQAIWYPLGQSDET
jgi:hypothetical protein